jgi:hypothetical protein
MKSIKPGRGPSGMNAIGAVAVVLFGLFWTGMAVMITRGAPMGIGFIFPMFGVIFVIVGIAQAAYHLKNAKGKERFSIMDIVDKKEEGDPADRWISNEIASGDDTSFDDLESGQFNYCPYCGEKLDTAYMYCPKCGKSVDK